MRLATNLPLSLPSRLDVGPKLGEGAFGNVYEVYDREQECRVALKSLERLDANSLYRFKREFRSLADITHPNLVRLHELFCVEDRWFFTMDLIQGVTFLEYVRPGVAVSRDETTMVAHEAEGPVPVEPGSIGALDRRKLRSALLQLTEGVGALHRAGKLHRDLKPQNVLVDRDGRVVVLDFGLLDDIHTDGASRAEPNELVGTPAYMAPEVAAGQNDRVESDWYSIGVMLYEALTGRLPYEGKAMSVLLQKQTTDPIDPEPLLDASLADLARLSMLLLARDPDERPTFDMVRAMLQSPLVVESDTSDPQLSNSDSLRKSDPTGSFMTKQPAEFLIGRERQLEMLAAAFRVAARGSGVMFRVHGRSGMGKSALVRFFVDDLRRSRQAVCLRGRCFECESVPYKALDSLVDALAQRLSGMPPDEVAPLLPPNLVSLARLFPVLRRVKSIAEVVHHDDLDTADPHEVRRSAFAALRSLLQNLGRSQPLVLWIDDLQWGDEDSAAFLADLLQPPDAPSLMLILSHRSEDVETSPILRLLLDSLPSAQYDHREIEVGPLAEADCRRLAMLLAREESERDTVPPPDIALESGGSPLFLLQLVRHASRLNEIDGAETSISVRLDDVLWDHVCSLSPPARRVLQVVALAGRSIEIGVARKAAEVSEELRESLDVLRMQRLVRTQGMRARDLVEPYHDRIREVVTARMAAADRVAVHRSLAFVLEASGRADPVDLVVHYRAAGDRNRAWSYAMSAAERAADALAFRRAAELYREALELAPDRDTHEMRVKLADALANAGHGAEASATYLQAVATAPARDAIELRRKAAEQSLRVGHIDEGLDLLEGMLSAAGMKVARTPWRAMLSLALRRVWLRVRGFGYPGRYDVDQEALRRIDMGWALVVGLSNSDPIRGADIQTRTLLLALNTGEPSRIARGLALEAGMLATDGPKNHRRVAKILDASLTLANKLGDAHTLGWAYCGVGATAYFEGRFEDCIHHSERILDSLATCAGVTWERATARHYAIWSLIWLGRVKEAARRVRAQLKAAFERGDLYSATDLRLFTSNLAWLVDDDVAGARRVADEAMKTWSNRGFHAQHYYALYARGQIDLYEGDGLTGLRRIEEAWKPLHSSMLTQIQSVRIEVRHLRARCALAAAGQEPADRRGYLAVAERDARDLRREHSVFSPAMGALAHAAVELQRGGRDACVESLRNAIEGFERAGMMLYAAVANRRLGALIGDGERVRRATQSMEAEGIVDVERWTEMMAPGLRER